MSCSSRLLPVSTQRYCVHAAPRSGAGVAVPENFTYRKAPSRHPFELLQGQKSAAVIGQTEG